MSSEKKSDGLWNNKSVARAELNALKKLGAPDRANSAATNQAVPQLEYRDHYEIHCHVTARPVTINGISYRDNLKKT